MYINPLSIPCSYNPGFYIHPDYPGYSVDCNGNVFSYRRCRMLNGSINEGYRKIDYRNGRDIRHHLSVHRLVAFHFVPLPLEYNGDYSLVTVDHIDGNKLNNHYTNLDWVSSEENIRRAWMSETYGQQLKPIIVIDKITRQIFRFINTPEAAKALGLNKTVLYAYFNQKRSGYVANRYICGYQDDLEFVSKLNNIDAMIQTAEQTTWRIRPIIVVDKITKNIYNYPSIREAARALGLKHSKIEDYLSHKRSGYIDDRYICGYQDDLDFIAKLNNIDAMIQTAEQTTWRIRPIVIIDKETRNIYNYSSIAEAERELGLNEGTISGYFSQKRSGYVANRYICGYQDDPDFMTRLNDINAMLAHADNNSRRIRPVVCYGSLTGVTTEYSSIGECYRTTGIKESTLQNHLSKGSKTPIYKRYTVTYKENN